MNFFRAVLDVLEEDEELEQLKSKDGKDGGDVADDERKGDKGGEKDDSDDGEGSDEGEESAGTRGKKTQDEGGSGALGGKAEKHGDRERGGGGSDDEIVEDGGEDGREEEEEVVGPLFPALSGWSLGSLVKNIASKSGEVLKEYRQEFEEFSQGLKKETEEFVEKTKHRVEDLPATIDKSAQVAQTSLEGVGHTIEVFSSSIFRGTTDIINQVKEAVAQMEEEAALNANLRPRAAAAAALATGIQKGKYSRYEAQVSAMQRDSSTYCDEPEDVEEFGKWKDGFKLEEKQADIDAILKDNAFMQELQSRIVPLIVERETFWTRYFYRLHKLQQAEDARADLVKRATTAEEEDLSWDVDDDESDTVKESPREEIKEKGGSDSDEDGEEEEEEREAEKEEGTKMPEKIAEKGESDKGEEGEEKEATVEVKDEKDREDDGAAGEAEKPKEGQGEVLSASDESPSDGSNSDWQVVTPEEEAAGNAPGRLLKESSSSASAKEEHKDKEESVPAKEESSESDEAPEKEKKVGAGVAKTPKSGAEDEDEDWGEWE